MDINYKDYLLEIIPSLDIELLVDITKMFYLSDSSKIFNKDKVRILRGLKVAYVYSLNEMWFEDLKMIKGYHIYLNEQRNLRKKQIKNLDRLINHFQYLQKCELNKQ